MLRSLIKEGCQTLVRAIRDRGDRHELAILSRALPGFDAVDAEARRARGDLDSAWRVYVTTVSTPVMAASLELSAFVLAFARILRPQRVLDLGSGFTSYVARQYAKETGDAIVVSVDDNAVWLDRTRAFLAANHLSSAEMWMWDEFAASSPRPFELVIHDLGSMSVREEVLPRILDLTAPHGLIVLDDIDHPKARQYAATARCLCQRARRRFLSARALTLDGYGRYAAIALPRRDATWSRSHALGS